MKVLITGPGVISTFYAARLRERGADVTLLARGGRLADLREHGVVLEGALGGLAISRPCAHPVAVDRLPS